MKRIVLLLSLVITVCLIGSCDKFWEDVGGETLVIHMDGHDELWKKDVSSAGCDETVSIYAVRSYKCKPTPVVYGKELIISEEGSKLGEGTIVPFVYDKDQDRLVAEYEDIRVVTTTSSYQENKKHPKGECQIKLGANPLSRERRVWVVLVYDMNEEWEKIPNRPKQGQEGIIVHQPAV